MYSVPYVLSKTLNMDLWAKIFQIATISIFCYDI